MADRNRYDYENRRHRSTRDQDFFDQVEGWFNDDDDDWDDRNWRDQQQADRYQNREDYQYGPNPENWQYRGRYNNRDYNRNFDRNYPRDFDRDRDYNRDFDRNRDRAWERTHQFRRSADHDFNRGNNRNVLGERYGQNYTDVGYNLDRDQPIYGYGRNRDRSFNYSEDYGRSYNRGDYDRDWESGRERRAYGRRDYQVQSDWDYDRYRGNDRYGRDYDRSGRFNQSRNRTAGMRSDSEGYSGQYRTAGMRSDFGRDYNEREYDDVNYAQGDVGYDRQGAFYQDLDEPENQQLREDWEISGEFTGMGPSNYQRSDENIEEEICERLTDHGFIDARNIEVNVKDGEVSLKGQVPSRRMKRMAEDLSNDVSGVQDIHNQLKIEKRDWARASRWTDPNYDKNQGDDDVPARRMAGQTTAGAGITSAGAISPSAEAMEAASGAESKKRQLREGMEVVGRDGKVVGRVKEIRQGDFLVDRDMARDIYVPYSAVNSVGAQAMLSIQADEVDHQGWNQPNIL